MLTEFTVCGKGFKHAPKGPMHLIGSIYENQKITENINIQNTGVAFSLTWLQVGQTSKILSQ